MALLSQNMMTPNKTVKTYPPSLPSEGWTLNIEPSTIVDENMDFFDTVGVELMLVVLCTTVICSV